MLLDKAAQDEYVLDLMLTDGSAPLEPLGFHAQQASEKLLKAAIRAAGVDCPLTHQIAELLDVARDAGVDVPPAFEELRRLSPFAVQFRYDALPPDGHMTIDIHSMRQLVADLRAWVEARADMDDAESLE